MRCVLAAFRFKSDPPQQPFVLGLQLEQLSRRRSSRHDRAWLVAAERRQAFEAQIERHARHAIEQHGNLVRRRVVDIADETQRQMIVFGIDPARAGHAAAQKRQRLLDVGGNFESGEQPRHRQSDIPSNAHKR